MSNVCAEGTDTGYIFSGPSVEEKKKTVKKGTILVDNHQTGVTRLGRLLHCVCSFDKLMSRSDRWRRWENSQQREMRYATNCRGTRDNKKWDAELSKCLLSR